MRRSVILGHMPRHLALPMKRAARNPNVYEAAFGRLESSANELRECGETLIRVRSCPPAAALAESIRRLLLGTYDTLLELAKETCAQAQKCAKEEKLRKIATDVENCADTIIECILVREVNEHEDLGPLSSRLPKLSDGRNADDDCVYVVCRICEQKVRIDKVERHTRVCIETNRNVVQIQMLNCEMDELRTQLKDERLNVGWPGNMLEASSVLIPYTRIVALIELAMQVDVNAKGAEDKLVSLVQSAGKCRSTFKSNVVAARVECAHRLIQRKVTASRAIARVEHEVRDTTMGVDRSLSLMSTVTISDFDFIKRISSGAFARVFLARKKTTGDMFAVKVIPKESVQQKNEIDRVLVERNVLLNSDHAYIVQFFYSIVGTHNLYLLMEFLQGGDLFSLLTGVGSLNEEMTKYYTYYVVMALKFLHTSGIIHRDLKPDNILLTATGTVKLTDFGLSSVGVGDRQKHVGGRVEASSSVVGTADYIAPEIIANESYTVTCDYWSLGVIIYEMLTGMPPFHGETIEETHRNIIRGAFTFDDDEEDEDAEEIGDDAKNIIHRLLTRDPARRLGAGGIEEIFAHPWFASFDKHAAPPFNPALEGNCDTSYFTQRHNFNSRDEQDILEDIRLQQQQGASRPPIGMRDFERVSFSSLGNANRQAVEEYHMAARAMMNTV